MKKLFFGGWSVLCLVIALTVAGCPPQEVASTFARSWGYNIGQFADEDVSMAPGPEGGVLVAASLAPLQSASGIYLSMIDARGDAVWEADFASPQYRVESSKIYGPFDGEYVLLGEGTAPGAKDAFHHIITVTRIYEGGASAAWSSIPFSDESVLANTAARADDIFAAWTAIHVQQGRLLYYSLWGQDGVQFWQNNLADFATSEEAPSVLALSEGFLMAGHHRPAKGLTPQVGTYVLRVDDAGDTLWTQSYETMDKDVYVEHVAVAPNGDFVLAADLLDRGESRITGFPGTLVTRIDASGNLLWQRAVDDYSRSTAVAVAQNGDILVAITREVDLSQWIAVKRLDSEGNLLWERVVGGDNNDEAVAITEAEDGGILILAESKSFTDPAAGDIYFVKLTADGEGSDVPEA